MPLAGGFLIWLAGMIGSLFLWRRGRDLMRRKRRVLALLCLSAAVVTGAVLLIVPAERPALADPQTVNDPIGTARGLNLGRVVWVHEPAATDWQGPGFGHWWESEHTLQSVVDGMLSQTVRRLSGRSGDAASWDVLFRHFNLIHGKGDVGYAPGEKIAVKINLVGCHYLPGWGGMDAASYDLVTRQDYMNTSPQMIVALLHQLVDVVGVDQADISIGDPLALFPNQYYDICHGAFPDVHYMDHNGGTAQHPRTLVTNSSILFHWSSHPTGVAADYVPTYYAEAAYLINVANLKSHSQAGITVCAKNHYGSLNRVPVASGYYDMHASLPSAVPATGRYRAVVDLLGHAQTGRKTLVYFVDGLYAGVHPDDSAPRRWDCAPFDGDWTSSLFASQDPIALDSVCFDLMQLEGDPRNYPRMAGTDDYLHEAALAADPPSGTYYDPNHDGDVERLSSLGVHEHWNNPTEMLYSRNLGAGDGIELVRVGPLTAVADAPGVPRLWTCNYPDPFNPHTTIRYVLPEPGPVTLIVYDLSGRIVRKLRNAMPEDAGAHEVAWNGCDESGRPVASGAYIYRLMSGSYRATDVMVLIK
jgi:hypothetical protein